MLQPVLQHNLYFELSSAEIMVLLKVSKNFMCCFLNGVVADIFITICCTRVQSVNSHSTQLNLGAFLCRIEGFDQSEQRLSYVVSVDLADGHIPSYCTWMYQL